MRALAALALLLLAPCASAATLDLLRVDAPERTVADHPFRVEASVRNGGADTVKAYLFAALYAREDGAECGPATDARFRTFTPLVQAVLTLGPGETKPYPAPGEDWLHDYDREDVSGEVMQFCVFVSRDSGSARIDYEDFLAQDLRTRAANLPPLATFSWSPETPEATQDVTFVAQATDADGDPVTFRWDFGHFNASGRAVASGPRATHFFFPDGEYTVSLVASDGFDETVARRTVEVVREGQGPLETKPIERERTPAPVGLVLLASLVALALRRR